jgi:hypothetical protein
MKVKCESCGNEIRKNKSGMCKTCYQKSPMQREQYLSMSATNGQKRKYKQVFSEWKILRDKKQLIVDLETSIDEHQAFVYKILSQRITEDLDGSVAASYNVFPAANCSSNHSTKPDSPAAPSYAKDNIPPKAIPALG